MVVPHVRGGGNARRRLAHARLEGVDELGHLCRLNCVKESWSSRRKDFLAVPLAAGAASPGEGRGVKARVCAGVNAKHVDDGGGSRLWHALAAG